MLGDVTSERPTVVLSEKKRLFGAVCENVVDVATAVPAPENVVVHPGGNAGAATPSKF
jgi:hypothetical protein